MTRFDYTLIHSERKRVIALIFSLTILLTVTGCDNFSLMPVTEEKGEFELIFLDVGQADCIYVRCGQSRMLIDGGNRADSSTVVNFLKLRGVDSIDYIVSTHPHEDHCGGLTAVINNFDVGMVISPVTEYASTTFKDLKKAMEDHGLEFTVPSPRLAFVLGSASFTVLGPLRCYDDMNDNSIVLRLEYGGKSFIFTGDAGYDAEQELLASYHSLDADVLQVGHHGSSSATCYLWLREVAPEYAVISVGRDNEYGHPSEKVLSRLHDADAEILRTDELGDITISVELGELIVSCSNGEAYQPAA